MTVNNYIHSTKWIMGVVNILGVFCFRTTQRGKKVAGGAVAIPPLGYPLSLLLCPAVAVWIVSVLCGAAPVDPF